MITRIKYKIINYLLKHLFNAITEDDVFKVIGGKLYINGYEVLETEKKELKYQAEALINNSLYHKINNKMINECNKMMFNNSKTIEDLFFGKAVLYSINLQKELIKKIINLK